MRIVPGQVSFAPLVGHRVPCVGTTTARVNGRPVVVLQGHRRCSAADDTSGAPETPERVVVTVSVPIYLTQEDVAAVLFYSFCTYEELADDESVRDVVADIVVNEGCAGLERRRCDLATLTKLTEDEVAFLVYCRQRAASVFCGHPGGCRPGAGAPW